MTSKITTITILCHQYKYYTSSILQRLNIYNWKDHHRKINFYLSGALINLFYKNTIITAVSCLVESKRKLATNISVMIYKDSLLWPREKFYEFFGRMAI